LLEVQKRRNFNSTKTQALRKPLDASKLKRPHYKEIAEYVSATIGSFQKLELQIQAFIGNMKDIIDAMSTFAYSTFRKNKFESDDAFGEAYDAFEVDLEPEAAYQSPFNVSDVR